MGHHCNNSKQIQLYRKGLHGTEIGNSIGSEGAAFRFASCLFRSERIRRVNKAPIPREPESIPLHTKSPKLVSIHPPTIKTNYVEFYG